MQKNQYKIVIAQGKKSVAKLVDGDIFKEWVLKDYKIGSKCEYEKKYYTICGGNARDGTPMHKMCTVRGFKKIKIYRKKKIKIRKRVHSAYLSEKIAQIFLKAAKN